MMCWMTWLPPQGGRDAATLRAFLDQLIHHTDDNPAGAGVSWLVPGSGATAVIKRALYPRLDAMVLTLIGRPASAWAIFHARRAPQGNRATKWCHPHRVRTHGTSGLVTYNGVARLAEREGAPLWSEVVANGIRVSPLLVPQIISAVGFDRATELGLPNTVVCYEEQDDADQAMYRIRAWRKLARFPLHVLANGGIATEGGMGEFAATAALPLGMTELDPAVGGVMLHDGPAESDDAGPTAASMDHAAQDNADADDPDDEEHG